MRQRKADRIEDAVTELNESENLPVRSRGIVQTIIQPQWTPI